MKINIQYNVSDLVGQQLREKDVAQGALTEKIKNQHLVPLDLPETVRRKSDHALCLALGILTSFST